MDDLWSEFLLLKGVFVHNAGSVYGFRPKEVCLFTGRGTPFVKKRTEQQGTICFKGRQRIVVFLSLFISLGELQ